MTITKEQISKMTDDEIVEMIVSGREILQERLDAQKKDLESRYAQKLRVTEGRVKKARKAKTRKDKTNAVAQAA